MANGKLGPNSAQIDPIKEEQRYLQEAEAGNGTAMRAMAVTRYRQGRFVGIDSADSWFRSAVAARDQDSLRQLALLWYGLDDSQWKPLMEQAANQSRTRGMALLDLGAHAEMQGDLDLAVELYAQSHSNQMVEGAYRIAQIRLAQGYEAGDDSADYWLELTTLEGANVEQRLRISTHWQLALLRLRRGRITGRDGAEHHLRRAGYERCVASCNTLAALLTRQGRSEANYWRSMGHAAASRSSSFSQELQDLKATNRHREAGYPETIVSRLPVRYVEPYEFTTSTAPRRRRTDEELLALASANRQRNERQRKAGGSFSARPQVDDWRSGDFARLKPASFDEGSYIERALDIVTPRPTLEPALPLPWVHYGDVFVAFSSTADDPAHLCECAKPAVMNWLEITHRATHGAPLSARSSSKIWDVISMRTIPLDVAYLQAGWRGAFPQTVPPPATPEPPGDDELRFARGICHRCCRQPTATSWNKRTGARKNYDDAYVRQAWYSAGIAQGGNLFLDDRVAPELAQLCNELVRLDHLSESFTGATDDEVLGLVIDADRVLSDRDLRKGDSIRVASTDSGGRAFNEGLVALRRLKREITAELDHRIGGPVREALADPTNVLWKSEERLAQIVKSLYPNEMMYRNYRPGWLEFLELDIYLPRVAIAFEYNGEQHYGPVLRFGGEEAFARVQERDRRKAELCVRMGIRLVIVPYTVALESDVIADLISSETG